MLLKCETQEGAENTFINGKTLISYDEDEESEEGYFLIKELSNNDRIIFGTSSTFLV